MVAVEIKDLCKNYAGENALRGVSFSASAGQLYGIIGADGAGKTTLIRILVTLIGADSGSASVLGYDVIKQVQRIRSEIGYMPQRFSLYQDLTVKENLLFFADVYGVGSRDRNERMAKLLQFSRLESFQKRRAANLSGGMKQKLALSCALIHTPKLLILDEPTTGVDPVSRREFWEILKTLRTQGITVIVSTPYMDEATICDSLLILHKGEVLRCGSPAELIKNYPYDIYKIESDSDTINCPQNVALPKGVVLMYPSGGFIHAVVDRNIQNRNELLSSIQVEIPEARRLYKSESSIEDLFFLLISEKEKQLAVPRL
jgi:ABC-type multidrug transport system ATPase subunit